MSEEKLLGSLCAACQLPAPLYDLEVTGGDQVTVCCIVGRLKVTWNEGNKVSAKEGAAKKMRLLITSQYQGTEQIIRKLSLVAETSEEETKEICFSAKNQFSSLEDLCCKIGLPGPVYDLEAVLTEDVHVCCVVGNIKMTAAHQDRNQAKLIATQRVLAEINKKLSRD